MPLREEKIMSLPEAMEQIAVGAEAVVSTAPASAAEIESVVRTRA
jgi:hypothetical protein